MNALSQIVLRLVVRICDLPSVSPRFVAFAAAQFVGRALLPGATSDGQECPSYIRFRLDWIILVAIVFATGCSGGEGDFDSGTVDPRLTRGDPSVTHPDHTDEEAAREATHRTSNQTDKPPHRLYDGLTLTEWRQRIKNLDPQSPESAAAVAGLMQIVSDDRLPWHSRRQAALTLGRIGAPARRAVPLMIAYLDLDSDAGTDAGRQTLLWSIKSLALFGHESKDAAPMLIELVDDRELPIDVRVAPLEALGRIGIGHPVVVPALIRLLAERPVDPSSDALANAATIRALTADALKLVGPDASSAVPSLIRAASDANENVRRTAVSALGQMQGRAEIAIPTLAELLVLDESPSVRDAAALALANVGPNAVPALQQLLTNDDFEVRWRAASALATLGPAAKLTATVLRNALQDEHALVRIHVIEAFWSVTADAETTIPAVLKEMTNADRQIRIRAFQLLTSMGPQANLAVDSLKEMLNDKRSYVRAVAAKALKSIDK